MYLREPPIRKGAERHTETSAHGTPFHSLLELQRKAGNRATVQLLKKFPTVNRPTETSSELVTDFSATPVVIDIANLTYKDAEHYRDVANQKKVDPKAHPDVVFDHDDIAALDRRIAELQPNQAEVLCMEGQAKLAGPDQAISYGDVTTCMTITAVMGNGTKVTAHEGLFGRVPGGAIATIKSLITSDRVPNKTVVRVLAAGVKWAWTTDLRPCSEGGATVEESESKFTRYLKDQFGAESTFENHDGGPLRLDKNGHKA